MARMIFPNLPVKNVATTTAFFTGLGFEFNAQFSSDDASCLVINDLASVMLLSEEYFQTFTTKRVADATQTAEVILAITEDSRADVDSLVDRAVAAGASEAGEAVDHGFMYQRAFHDLDGHKWEVFWMNPDYVEQP